MGYTEDKAERIKQLETNLAVATKEQARTKADAEGKTAALNSRSIVFTQDDKDRVAALNNAGLNERAVAISNTAAAILKSTRKEKLDSLMKLAFEMAAQSRETADRTVRAAKKITDLANLIDKTKTKNKLISDLLIQDAKKAIADAAKAVNDSITALTDAINASGAVVHLSESIDESMEQLDAILELLDGKGESLSHDLKAISNKAISKSNASGKERDDAQAAADEANNKLLNDTAVLNAATAALNAANVAVAV